MSFFDWCYIYREFTVCIVLKKSVQKLLDKRMSHHVQSPNNIPN